MASISLPRIHGRSRVRITRPSEKRSLSRSATRALDVLEVFGERRCPLRALDIRDRLGLSPSTTAQLLKTMVDSGHLVFDAPTKSYRPSPRLAGFSGWLAAAHGSDAGLGKLIDALQSATGAIVTLSTPNDMCMQIVDFAGPPDWSGERGLRISLFGSTIGSAHLSTLGETEVRRLIARARLEPAEASAIEEALAQIRIDGHADGPNGDGESWSIAMPLQGADRDIRFVLGVAGPTDDVLPRREPLRRAMIDAIGAWRRGGG